MRMGWGHSEKHLQRLVGWWTVGPPGLVGGMKHGNFMVLTGIKQLCLRDQATLRAREGCLHRLLKLQLVLLATEPAPLGWKRYKFSSEPCSLTASKLLRLMDLIMRQSRIVHKVSQSLGQQQTCHRILPSERCETPWPGREGRKLLCCNFEKKDNYYNTLKCSWPEKKKDRETFTSYALYNHQKLGLFPDPNTRETLLQPDCCLVKTICSSQNHTGL